MSEEQVEVKQEVPSADEIFKNEKRRGRPKKEIPQPAPQPPTARDKRVPELGAQTLENRQHLVNGPAEFLNHLRAEQAKLIGAMQERVAKADEVKAIQAAEVSTLHLVVGMAALLGSLYVGYKLYHYMTVTPEVAA